jgi:uncharacterized protein (TIGR02466 family)
MEGGESGGAGSAVARRHFQDDRMSTHIASNLSGLGTPPAKADHHPPAEPYQTVGVNANAPEVAPGEFELTSRVYWPSLIFSRKYRDHDRDAAGIVVHLTELKAQQTRNIESRIAESSKSAAGLYESDFDLFKKNTHEGLGRLISFIEASVRRAVWHANGRSVDPARIEIDFCDSWYHITNNSGFHDAHYHGGCSWCGIYYLQIDPPARERPGHAPSGVNRFYAPRSGGGILLDYGNTYLGQDHLDVPPIPGTLVIFPAFLLHSGLPYSGTLDRVILSFNSRSTLKPEA